MARFYFLFVFIFVIFLSCSSEIEKSRLGEEGEECFANNVCKHGLNLQCIGGICVDNCKKYCENDGVCKVENDSNNMFCECREGTSGERCEIVDYCRENPCKNGSCKNENNHYVCTCEEGYKGDNCDIDVDECYNDLDDCHRYANCINTTGSFICNCKEGYSGDGKNQCIFICDSERHLVVNEGNNACVCVEGYHDEDGSCIKNTCTASTCLNGGVCMEEEGIISCDCSNTGYKGNNCEIDINECQVNLNLCQNNGVCINTDGSYTCECESKYEGKHCEKEKNRWYDISTGRNHTCGIRGSGKLYCWGYNNYGELGIGNTIIKYAPKRVGNNDNWKKVSIGVSVTCAINTENKLYCWGLNSNGQLGQGDNRNRKIPFEVGHNLKWKEVSAGQHICAINTDNKLYCWGYNGYGQLGTGDTSNRYIPTLVN